MVNSVSAIDANRSVSSTSDKNSQRVASNHPATIHQWISETAASAPDTVAVSFEQSSNTYAELETRSNQLAHHLLANGLSRGDLVGVYVERSIEMLVGVLGVLKAGGTYVPLDPAYPSDRIAHMLSDSNAQIILSQASLVASLPPNQAKVISLDGDQSAIASEPETKVAVAVGPEDLAYVIYTSGSTGKPKGVAISHWSVVNFLASMRETPGFGADDRLLAVTTLSFDIAGLELYLPLVTGAHVVIASRAMAADGNRLAEAIVTHGITVMQATPATWRVLLDSNWSGNSNLRIFCGGETLTRELAERLLGKCAQLWNLYGPTETTIWSTVSQVISGTGSVSIGRAIANTELLILDEDLKLVSPGTPGELYIGGDGLARGYFKRDELTAERFIPHPEFDDARIYKTGDLVKSSPDGSLEHMGRVDFQVKVRGFRIELGEIESVLDHHPLVQQSVVMAREDVPGEKRLVGYVVPAESEAPSSRELRDALAVSLPDYMVPGLYVTLDAFPLTPNGKVDRNALPAPDTGRSMLEDEYVEPGTESEKALAEIWAEVLRVEKVGLHDNFFELGGDSLKIAQVATRIRDVFNTDIFLSKMFENPTVGSLLPVIEAAGPQDAKQELAITSVKRGDHIPLSFAQERVWLLHQISPDNLAYNFQLSFDFRGELDVPALERTLDEILVRHESYRTSFPNVNGRPAQIVHPAEVYTLPIVDFTALPESEHDAAIQAWCDKEFPERFDLAKLPLVKWTLLRFSETKNLLMHIEHHLVHDGWAFNAFLHEVVELYSAFAQNKPSPLPEMPIQFAEFATWQHQWMQGEVSDKQLAYWTEKFKTIPPALDLPTKGPRPSTQTFRGAVYRPEVPIPLCNDLRNLSREEGSTMFMTMLAGFIALLHRYTGETDIPVGTFFANRRSKESECLIGMILNNVVVRAALDTNPTVRDLMKHVRDVVLEGSAHQDVPFDRVVGAVQPKRDMSRNPLFQVMFSFHDEPMPEAGMHGLDVKLTPVLSNGSAKFDLGIIGIPHSAQYLGLKPGSEQDGMTMIWEHNTDLFETETIAQMFKHYESLLRGMTENPAQRVSELPLVTAAEFDQILGDWNETDVDVAGDGCLHEIISVQAAATPNAVAVVDESTELTYRELEERSNQLANHLRSIGVGPEAMVGICVDRSVRMLVGLLGILKAGSAYVPIDPAFPIDRQQFMVDDAALKFIVTERDLVNSLVLNGASVVSLDSDAGTIAAAATKLTTKAEVTRDNLAYVIFTSGSTGKPKGVQIPHRAIVNFVRAMADKPGIDQNDRLFAVTTLSFDIAGLELYLPLTCGARVIIGSREVVTNGEELIAQLNATGATIMQATPTSWQMLIDSGWQGGDLTALCGGEALPRALAEQLLPRVKRLWNMYGPTETTVWSTIHPIESVAGNIPIGRPIHNTQIYILDKYDNQVPTGVIGELCIGGNGVALGYLNRPDLTAERFIDNPVPSAPAGKIYRTGDLARYRPDGKVECLGRTDHQIKLRGFRIELGEIEALLAQQPGINQVAAIVSGDANGEKRIVAYYQTDSPDAPKSTELRAALREKLPDYMLPAQFVGMDSFPLTPNGKIDRLAFPEPEQSVRDFDASYVAPETEIQIALAEIWSAALGVEKIGIGDNFFDLGGHSLMVTRVLAHTREDMGFDLPIRVMFQGPTIAELEQACIESQLSQLDDEEMLKLLNEVENS